MQFDHAYRWGLKAAQAGLPRHANPYRASHVRAAWEIGYARHASGGLERYRHR
ncbi:ribosome modulation factor [Novosphingobium lindaniclasticum]|uniref:ribosome modulation factor n=1 Tax=Novosphingobium lindaniclasticum TaxID=1329895 RepID=UPI003C6E08FE